MATSRCPVAPERLLISPPTVGRKDYIARPVAAQEPCDRRRPKTQRGGASRGAGRPRCIMVRPAGSRREEDRDAHGERRALAARSRVRRAASRRARSDGPAGWSALTLGDDGRGDRRRDGVPVHGAPRGRLAHGHARRGARGRRVRLRVRAQARRRSRYTFGTGKVGALGGFASAVGLAVIALLVWGRAPPGSRRRSRFVSTRRSSSPAWGSP